MTHGNGDWNKKQTLTETKQVLIDPCVAQYAKNKDNMVTSDASKTELGLTLWQKQNDGNLKPTAYRSRCFDE